MEIPPSLEFSVNRIERALGRSIEALVVPWFDVKKYHTATKRPLSRKVAKNIASSERRPLVTTNIADCNSVILFKGSKFTLIHESSSIDPSAYLPRFLDKLKSKESLKDLLAIQVAGDEEMYHKIGAIINSYNVPIVNSYRDGWNTGKDLDLDDKTGQKDIIGFPDERKIVLNKRYPTIKCGKVVRLSDTKVLYEW